MMATWRPVGAVISALSLAGTKSLPTEIAPLERDDFSSNRHPPGDGAPGTSVDHDLHLVAHLDLSMCFQPVQNAETLCGAVDAGHAVGQRFHGVAGLHGDDLDAQRPCG